MKDFDEKAEAWDSEPRRVELARCVASVIRRHVPVSKKMTAFEYGCGTGLLSLNLHSYLGTVKMADISDAMLDVLRGKVNRHGLTGVEIEKLDLTENFKPHGSYDIVYTQMALHHIIDVEKLLGVFYQMINPSGYLCIADLDEEDGTFHAADFQGHNGFNQSKLGEILRELGFKDIKTETAFNITKEASDGITKTFPVFLMSARKQTLQ